MDTSALIRMTWSAASTMPHAKLWPNRIGFDARGWEYCYSEQKSCWFAGREYNGHSYIGTGATPSQARINAQRY